MYNNDNDYFVTNEQSGEKTNIPNDLSNISIVGDTADRQKQIKLKLNHKRVKDIYN